MEFPVFDDATEKIIFNVEDVDFEQFDDAPTQLFYTQWIETVAKKEGKTVESISYIFCSDEYLHKINLEYLDHDTLTDIITFPYNRAPLEGDIFISIDRVTDNAQERNLPFEVELRRVMIHGILHLCGYLDETDQEEALMRQKEDTALTIFNDLLTKNG